MTPTELYIDALQSLKDGDLGRLRKLAGLSLDETVDGFDLFAGLWWPLRAKYEKTPRREVAWLVAKLHGFRRIRHVAGATLARQLGRLKPADKRHQRRFDALLVLPLSGIEPALQWALTIIDKPEAELDWVRLTNELSLWEHEETRLRWAAQYLQITA